MKGDKAESNITFDDDYNWNDNIIIIWYYKGSYVMYFPC